METWEEATQLISRSLKTINGCLRLFRLDGREVLSLQELWEAGNTLVAAGNERFDIVEFLKGESGKSNTIIHLPRSFNTYYRGIHTVNRYEGKM